MTDFELRNYGEELSKIFQRKKLTDKDIDEIARLIKNMVDEQLKLGIPTQKLTSEDEEVLKIGIGKLNLNDIKYYVNLFKDCGFNSTFIIKFIWLLIHATRNIG